MTECQWIDISPPLSATTPVWPGDRPFQQKVQCRLVDGDSVNLSSIETSVHIGAHADAPYHYHENGQTVEMLDLDPYLGECFVIDCTGAKSIGLEYCQFSHEIAPKRVLFKTRSQLAEKFERDFCFLLPEAVAHLGRLGVKLIGIDTPSVDPFDSKELSAHNVFYQYDMRNLEGLDLSKVKPGRYELIALPLPLVGLDGSPVRAILRLFP